MCVVNQPLMGIARVILGLYAVFGRQTLAAAFDMIVTNILSMFIVIELLRSLIEYFTVHRLKITFIDHDRNHEFVHAVDYLGEVFHRHCPFVILEDAAQFPEATTCGRILPRLDYIPVTAWLSLYEIIT